MQICVKTRYIVPSILGFYARKLYLAVVVEPVYPVKDLHMAGRRDSFEIWKSKGMVVRKSDLEYPVCSRISSLLLYLSVTAVRAL
ncbi:MAG: hypothetical protein ACLRWA_10745 [Lachnospira sp.]